MEQDYEAQQQPWWLVLTPCVAAAGLPDDSESAVSTMDEEDRASSGCLGDGAGNTNLLSIIALSASSNKAQVLEAVQHDGFALRCASRALRRDLEVCLAAVAQAGGALEFVDDSLRTNCRLVRCATAQDPRSIVFATTPASEAALRMAARERPSAACKCGILRRSLLHVARNVLSDKEAMLPVLRHHGNHLKHCAAHLRADREVCFVAVAENGDALRYCSEALRGDRALVELALTRNGLNLVHASAALKGDRILVEMALARHGSAIKFAPSHLRNDRHLAKACVQNFPLGGLPLCGRAARSDPEVVLAAVELNGSALQSAAAPLRDDLAVVLASVRQDGEALQFASKQLRDADVVVAVAAAQSPSALSFASPRARLAYNQRSAKQQGVGQGPDSPLDAAPTRLFADTVDSPNTDLAEGAGATAPTHSTSPAQPRACLFNRLMLLKGAGHKGSPRKSLASGGTAPNRQPKPKPASSKPQ